MNLDPKVFATLDRLRRDAGMRPVTPVTRPILPVLPRNASNDGAGNTVTPVTRKKHVSEAATDVSAHSQNRQSVGFKADPVVVPDPAAALNRPMSYLLAPDHLIEGLCLMTQDDLADIRSGRLPLASARLYLEREEAAHPHLAERLKCARMAATEPDKMPDTRHPLDVAIERLRLDGLEVHPDDAKFIRARIGTRANWRDLLNRYLETWLLAAATEPAPHRRQNAGRRAANSWLLGVAR